MVRRSHVIAWLGATATALTGLGCAAETVDTGDGAVVTTAQASEAALKSTAASEPGAMVKVTFTAEVGVLLDEVPTPDRERLATRLLQKPAHFWIERAHNQIELTQYKLTFREYYYDADSGKKSLNLPPPSVAHITLDGKAARTKIGKHDYVSVRYAYESMILSDTSSIVASDAAFAVHGGKATEDFVLPGDPELVMQRTGYACIDEAEFPPNSADAESVATYYDDTCTAKEDQSLDIRERCHQQQPLPTEDCNNAVRDHIGRVPVRITFERVKWSESAAAPYRVAEWTSSTGADVQPVTEALDTNYIVYKYIAPDSCAIAEECVGGTGWRRLLRFDAFLKNTGKKDMEIGDVDYFTSDPSGQGTTLGQHNIFEYSACHDHFHFVHYGQFDLVLGGTSGGNVIGSKRAFCLETGTRHFNDEFTPTVTEYSGCEFQGLTRGWGDEYGASLDCQWFDITDVSTSQAPVPASIRFAANPDGFLCEGNPVLDANGNLTFEPTSFVTEDGHPVDRPVCDYHANWNANNTGERPTTLPKTGGYVTGPCLRGQMGPLRDCGFTELGLTACTPGAKVTRKLATGKGATPNVVRICEASAVLGTGVACTYLDALANTIVGAKSTSVTFTCPTARSSSEPGGQYALYAAPLVDGDALSPLAP